MSFLQNSLSPHTKRILFLAAAAGLSNCVARPSMVMAQYNADQYVSTGDNLLEGQDLPMDDAAAITDSFNLMKALYGTQTVYWRGLQESSYIDTVPRTDNVYINSVIQNSTNLLNNQNLNQTAVQIAHSLGMQIWGTTQLYDWGVPANDSIFYGYPGDYQTTFAAQNPQWAPVNQYGNEAQGGALELAYPGARSDILNWTMNAVNQAGYDGVLFMTYQENFTNKYNNEFGYSAPVVNAYEQMYGVNILTNPNFNQQEWYDLRGSYTTTFLGQMESALSSDGKQLGMALGATNPSQGTYWDGETFADAGNMTMAWQTWAQQGDVNRLVVWGSDPDTYNTVVAGVQGTGVQVSMLTSQPYASSVQPVGTAGGNIIGAMNTDVEYLLDSNMATQPISALSSSNEYQRMHVLAQIAAGQTTATSAEVLPLLNDSNIITVRLALTALGTIADPSSVSSIEGELTNSEEAIRTAAVYALEGVNGPNSAQAILNAVAEYGEPNFDTGAVAVLSDISTDLPLLQSSMSSSNNLVREIAMQSIFSFNGAIPSTMLPTIQTALSDSQEYVRRYAVDAIGRISSDPTGVSTLMGLLTNSDPDLSDQAASTLSEMLITHDSAAAAQRSTIVADITSLFEQFDTNSTRSDASWGYEPVGEALKALVPDGLTQLVNLMNQRNDETISMNAWNIIYEPQTPGSLPSMTQAQDAYAQFKAPVWTSTVTSADSFDTKVNGSQINGQTDQLGNTWTVVQGNASGQTIQSTVNHGGQALETTAPVGGNTLITVASNAFYGQARGLSTYIAKADMLRPTTTDLTTFGVDVGTASTEAQVTIGANSYYEVWKTNGTANGGSFVPTNFQAGTGGWENIQIVIHWNAVAGLATSGDSTITGDYDVYLSRAAGDSLGYLPQTMIASDIPLYNVTEQMAQSLFISDQSNGVNGVTTYWDNVSMTLAPATGTASVPMTPLSWDNAGAAPGFGTDTNWDTGVSQNWSNGSGYPTTYADGSPVTFNDTNNGNYTVTINSTVTPGSVTVSNSLGNYTFSGAGSIAGRFTTLTMNGPGVLTLANRGVNTYGGGTIVNNGTVVIAAAGSLPAASNVTITGGALQLANNTGVETLSSLSISGNGVLDIGNNNLFLSYQNGSDPIASIAAYLKSGFNGGGWNGPGIISSAAQTPTNGVRYGVGWADGADNIVSGLGSGQIELKYTLLGDANLDGVVNGSDFSILAANFGLGVTNWDQGNFLYGSAVNGSDFSALAANFGQGDSGPDTSILASDLSAIDAFAVANGLPLPTFHIVPEPMSGGLLAFAGIAAIGRRKRNATNR